MLLTREKNLGDRSVAEETDRVEMLRQILNAQNNCKLAYDEARQIGDALIEFYQVLAEDLGDD